MRNYKKTIGALAAVTALAGFASAEIEGDVYAGYATQYNFRGVNFGDDLIETGINLSTTCPLTGGALTLGAWYGSVSDDVRLTDDQLNTSLGISKEYYGFDFGVGIINYNHLGNDYMFSPLDTTEAYVSLGREIFGGLRAGVTGYYDFDEFDGWYIEPALSYRVKVHECINLDLGAGCGIYQSYGNPNVQEGVNHWFVSAALPWTPRENLTVTPYVKYVDTSSNHFSGIDGMRLGTGENEVIGGVRVNVAF